MTREGPTVATNNHWNRSTQGFDWKRDECGPRLARVHFGVLREMALAANEVSRYRLLISGAEKGAPMSAESPYAQTLCART